MTRSLVASGRWSLTPVTLLLETIRASDCGRPRRVVVQTRGRPRQVLLYMKKTLLEIIDEVREKSKFCLNSRLGLMFQSTISRKLQRPSLRSSSSNQKMASCWRTKPSISRSRELWKLISSQARSAFSFLFILFPFLCGVDDCTMTYASM